jgi:HlyD family secretion protein
VVTSFQARSSEEIPKGQPMVRLTPSTSDQAPLDVVSPFRCRMLNRNAKTGDTVKKGAPLLTIESLDEPLLARLYIPVTEGYQIESKMEVHVWPANVKKDEFGYLKGKVLSAAKFPITRQELAERLQNDDLAAELSAGGPKLQILVQLIPADTISGYQWSTTDGPPLHLYSGTPCQGQIIIAEDKPIHLVFPALGR